MQRPSLRRIANDVRGGTPGKRTLLAVCPNSRAVTMAALEAACEADAPLLFAATLNQVDLDGGYTGWTPRTFVQFVEEESIRIGLQAPVYVCLDHGGPWLKDGHAEDRLPLDVVMQEVERSIEACVLAGYQMLHIDATADPFVPSMDQADVIERTADLVAHAEDVRQRHDLPAVEFELSVGGSSDCAGAVPAFLDALGMRLRHLGRPDVRPLFIDVDLGTSLTTGTLDEGAARRQVTAAREHGVLLKGHYTDFADAPFMYPIIGVGGANVGPEFSAAEFDALTELERTARAIGRPSDFAETVSAGLQESGRWRKWLRGDERSAAFDRLPPMRRQWLLRTGSRYVWTHPDVLDARQKLYADVSDLCDPDAFVRWRIRTAIMRYFHAFNLVGAGAKLR